MKTPERRYWHRSGVFINNFRSYFTLCSSAVIANFEQVNAAWAEFTFLNYIWTVNGQVNSSVAKDKNGGGRVLQIGCTTYKCTPTNLLCTLSFQRPYKVLFTSMIRLQNYFTFLLYQSFDLNV